MAVEIADSIRNLGYGLSLPPGLAVLLNVSTQEANVDEVYEHRPDIFMDTFRGDASLEGEWAFSQINGVSPLSFVKGTRVVVPTAKFVTIASVRLT